jgi:hypothetical protein
MSIQLMEPSSSSSSSSKSNSPSVTIARKDWPSRPAMCHAFVLTGVCPKGDTCRYDHDVNRYKTTLCHHWKLGQPCPNGYACCYAHGRSEMTCAYGMACKKRQTGCQFHHNTLVLGSRVTVWLDVKHNDCNKPAGIRVTLAEQDKPDNVHCIQSFPGTLTCRGTTSMGRSVYCVHLDHPISSTTLARPDTLSLVCNKHPPGGAYNCFHLCHREDANMTSRSICTVAVFELQLSAASHDDDAISA